MLPAGASSLWPSLIGLTMVALVIALVAWALQLMQTANITDCP